MQTLVDSINQQISNLDNVKIVQDNTAQSPQDVADLYDVPIESVV